MVEELSFSSSYSLMFAIKSRDSPGIICRRMPRAMSDALFLFGDQINALISDAPWNNPKSKRLTVPVTAENYTEINFN